MPSTTETILKILDASANVVTITTPALVPASKLDVNGNSKTLEETAEIMDWHTHDMLQEYYDCVQSSRTDLKFCAYAKEAAELNESTITSSQEARSKHLWTRKRTLDGPSLDAAINHYDNTSSMDITSIEENPFHETASVIVPDYVFDLVSESSVADSESAYFEPGDIGYHDSLLQ
ncbi:hypothetical protein POSPLADRAFT_1046143 [Postia placenta MAD-698-R-SB12]|uniref:Uncharacterized protein n=1 Tax=Postia placenta MAD-698-R-SB12 TaxID=670580 RepID=A0A1X6N2B0_9APHY|nr:hypothetical protein POSPLADRAFT_1046143 [Postia placenta MAD-698-R-SB12]OSX62738.1 hypothetical protein POSPLADRAFT_1046143 [Postia placenta MAD-698-R-SB12]